MHQLTMPWWWMVGVMLVAGCEPDSRSCGLGGHDVLVVNKALIVGVFLHRVEAVETLEGDYELPPPSDEWVRVEAAVDEGFWRAERTDGVVTMRIIDHVSRVEGRCPFRFDVGSQPWSERLYVRLDATRDLDGSLDFVDPTLAYVEPTTTFTEYVTWAQLFAIDEGRLGFTLRADYYVEPAGCDDPSCSSTVRLTHHFRRP